MTRYSNDNTTPGGRSTLLEATKHSDSGELGLKRESKSECSGKLPHKTHSYIGTFNIQTLIQVGKLHNLTEELHKQKIQILALQETRFTDSDATDYNGYRLFKSGTNRKCARGAPLFGMAFAVNTKILDSITDVKPINNRLMTLRLKHKNKKYTLVNVHAPTNAANKKDPENTEKFWEKLELEMSKIPKDDVVILLGDFNAQIGKEKKYRKTVGYFPAHKFTNTNGTRLIDLCKLFNLKLMSTSKQKTPKKQKTWRSPIQQLGEYQIDHVAISYNYQKEIHDVQVRKGANIDSDHYLTRIKVKFTPKRKTKTHKNLTNKIDLKKIPNITEILENSPTPNWTQLQTTIINTARKEIPLTRRPKHPWWDEECENALETRQKAFQTYNSNKTERSYETFLKVRRNMNKIIRQIKRNYVNNQLKSIEENFRNYNTHDFYRTFASQIKGYTPHSLCFRKTDGKLALNNRENCQTLAKYFETLLNCPQPTTRFQKILTETNLDSLPPTLNEIKLHIKRLKNNRTSGEDGIVAELLKGLGPKKLIELTTIIQEIWTTEKLPEDWKTALIHPLHKKGDKTDVNNYRGISLLSVTYKILSACLLQRTQEQVENKISEFQAGFRPNRSCAEQILNLKSILKIQALRSHPTICTFVDFKKAYDSIDREALFNTLTEYGLDDKTRRLIQATLTETKSKVKFMGEVSDPFEIRTGVRQGDGLSPLLFNIVLDKVMKEWESKLKKTQNWRPVRLGKHLEIPYLAFADDLAILAVNPKDAIIQIETLKECAEKVGLQISFEKTKFMATKTEINLLKTQYGTIKRVQDFKYLGEIIEPTGLEKKAQENRTQKMKRGLGLVQNLYNKKCMSTATKIRHFNTVIKPTILYASETLALNRKKQLENIKKEERKIIRKILGPRKTEQGYRLQQNKVTEKFSNIEEDIRKRRLKFYGHIHRLPEYRLTKQIFNIITNFKVTTHWVTQTKLDLNRVNITESEISDKNLFRNKIDKWKFIPEIQTRPRRAEWTDERRLEASRRMKAFWSNKKNK